MQREARRQSRRDSYWPLKGTAELADGIDQGRITSARAATLPTLCIQSATLADRSSAYSRYGFNSGDSASEPSSVRCMPSARVTVAPMNDGHSPAREQNHVMFFG